LAIPGTPVLTRGCPALTAEARQHALHDPVAKDDSVRQRRGDMQADGAEQNPAERDVQLADVRPSADPSATRCGTGTNPKMVMVQPRIDATIQPLTAKAKTRR
jgi:hypothetical protein